MVIKHVLTPDFMGGAPDPDDDRDAIGALVLYTLAVVLAVVVAVTLWGPKKITPPSPDTIVKTFIDRFPK